MFIFFQMSLSGIVENLRKEFLYKLQQKEDENKELMSRIEALEKEVALLKQSLVETLLVLGKVNENPT